MISSANRPEVFTSSIITFALSDPFHFLARDKCGLPFSAAARDVGLHAEIVPVMGDKCAPPYSAAAQYVGLHAKNVRVRGGESRSALEAPAKKMRLCTITGIDLGSGDFGISPGEGEVCMTLRAEAEEDMREMEASMLHFAQNTARDEGLGIQYSIHDYFPETRNHEPCLQKVLSAAGNLGLASIAMPELWRASEDFGYYLKECPGAMFYIGSGEGYPPLHTVEYDFNDRILETAADLFLALIG